MAGARRRCALVVDEAITVTEDELGRRALGDLARRGRHFGVELHVLTQRVTDWFDTQIGRAIQSNAANAWYGQMEDRELREVVEHGTDLSPEEQDRIRRAGQGEGLLLTAGRRVWVTLYGHTSPDEFEAFNTDREEADVGDDAEDLAGERRNGMSWLGRWLDPPQQIARKRALRAVRGRGHSGDDRQLEIGCLVPLGLLVAVLVGAGVLLR